MLSLESHIRLFNEKSCKVVSEYMKVIDIIFCKLNIRNCIMHGLGETFDYLNIGIVAIMFQLLWDVVACEIFID